MSDRSLGDAFARFFASVVCMAATVGLGILVMIYGWGLSARSWRWIVWGAIGQLGILIVSVALRD